MPMEKQGTVENQLAHTIDQTEYDSRYDRTAKKLLANKQILAQIMKGCVNEYSDCTVDDIVEKYIEGTPEVGSVGVHVDDTNRPKKSFIFIIVIERPLGHAGRRGDLGQRDIGKRLRVQQAGRGVEDLLLDIVVARSGHLLSSFLIL